MSGKDQTVAEARSSLASLEARKEAIEARKTAVATERERLAHAALAEGDKAAQGALDALTREALKLGADAENLSAALATAQRRVTEAEAREARAMEITNAEKARELISDRQKIATQISKTLGVLAEGADLYVQSGRALAETTGRHVNRRADPYALVQAFLWALSPLTRAGLVELPSPEASMRKPLPQLCAQADATHENWIKRVLGEDEGENRVAESNQGVSA